MSDSLNLHTLYQRNAACGYDRDLLLLRACVQDIAALNMDVACTLSEADERARKMQGGADAS